MSTKEVVFWEDCVSEDTDLRRVTVHRVTSGLDTGLRRKRRRVEGRDVEESVTEPKPTPIKVLSFY